METIACPSCRYINSTSESACVQCTTPLAEAKLLQSIENLRQTTEKMSAMIKPRPSFYTFNGFGTTLLDYRPLPDGTYEATRWVTAMFMPLVPLSVYIIRPEKQEHSYGRETSTFNVLGKGRLTASRVLRPYLILAIGLLPLVLGFIYSNEVNRTLGGPKAFFAMLAAFAWAIYFVFVKIRNDGKAYKTDKTKVAA